MDKFVKIAKIVAIIVAVVGAIAGIVVAVKKIKEKKCAQANCEENFVSCSCCEVPAK